jgi:hypothetical protein
LQINVRRGGFGPMGGAFAALGIGAGLMGIIEPVFRPIAAGSVVLGAGVAAILLWRRREESHPTVSRHADTDGDAQRRS